MRGSERTQTGSERTQTGSERTRNGSERTRNGSERTRAADEGEFDLAAQFMEPSEGWWTSYGFESFGAYLRYSQTGPDRPGSLTLSRKKKDIPGAKPPSGAVPSRQAAGTTRGRQVSIRLDEDGYQELVKAARMYGVAPATMGRLLVLKGARLAVEAG